jgi:hypothetical protein
MNVNRRFTISAAAVAVVGATIAGASATTAHRHSPRVVAQHDLRVAVERFLAAHPDISLTIEGRAVPATVVAAHAAAASRAPGAQLSAPALTALIRTGMASVTLDSLLLLDGRAHGRVPTAADVDGWLAQQQASARRAPAGATGPDDAAYVTGQSFDAADRHAVASGMTLDAERQAVLKGVRRDGSHDVAALRDWLRGALTRYDVSVSGVGLASTADLARYLA